MTALVLFPLALGILLVGAGLAWPIAYRAGLQSPDRDEEWTFRQAYTFVDETPEPVHERLPEYGYQGLHRWGTAIGCATQERRFLALCEPTEEFRAIIATSYRSGEIPMYGQAGMVWGAT